MPFTFAHPAIVLPLKYLPGHWFSFTGLIIGSMVPDFEYFIRMKIQSSYSHTLPGLFWFDMPLGLFLAFIFHNVVKARFIENLPATLQSRFQSLKLLKWNKYFIDRWHVVLISILIGAASHLFWDSFTHSTGYFAQKIPGLSQQIEIFGRQVPTVKILQHLSTLLGGVIIFIAIKRLPVNVGINAKPNPDYWIIFFLLSITIVSIRFLTGLEIHAYGNVIVTFISASLISLIITPILMRMKNRK